MRHRTKFGVLIACGALLSGTAWGQFGGGGPRKSAKVEIVASVEKATAGEAFDVGLRFLLPDGWHMYWANSGESGLPPKIEWSLPAGFSAGPWQFPIPKQHVSAGIITTNILEGEPVLLASITPPATLAASTVNLSAKITLLMCQKSCIRDQFNVSLKLPVQTAGTPTKTANEALFRRARKAMPTTTSKYITVAARTEPATPTPSGRFEALIDVNIKRGFHLQSNTPLSASFIKTEVFLHNTNGLFFDDAIYPPPKFRQVKYLGKVSEYEGRITIRIPGEVDADTPVGRRTISGILRYQACNAKGTCFPPTAVKFAGTPFMLASAGSGSPRPDVENADHHDSGSELVETVAGASDNTPVEPAATPSESPDKSEATSGDGGLEEFFRGLGLPGLLAACFLYGLFINATPCVLPLLSIKVLGFVQQAHESRGRTLMLGLSFGAGVVIFFIALGFFASRGHNVLHYPGAVIALGGVVLALALSMLGVYTLQVPTSATKLDAAIQKEGVVASFGKGALAPVLGFACTGPLLAGVFGWATQQAPDVAFFAFLVTGIGMASPYVLLGANPQWLSFLPKPGQWMITFERIMGFLLLGMVVWLLHPLIGHIGAEGLEWTLGFFVFVAMACWILGQINFSMTPAVRWRYRGGAVAVVVGTGALVYGWIYPLNQEIATVHAGPSKIAWRVWSQEAVEESVRGGHTVFVDFTANYCTNCKANHAAATYRSETIAKIADLGIVPFRADFSEGDPDIFAGLQKFQRAGPPLNLIYPAGQVDKPIVMSTLFGLSDLLDAFDKAGPSRAQSASAVRP